jgi:SAM-dependent methyltransferase
MASAFRNVYEDRARAEAYAQLECPGTYYLAYRDLPLLFRAHVRGIRALDFGCGAGRSTRFLKGLGFATIGVDISVEMLERARERDPEGEYLLTADDALAGLPAESCDLILAAFTFDNIPSADKVSHLRALRRLLRPTGRLVSVVSTPEIYRNAWASFSTKDFPGNAAAQDGDPVRIVMLDVPDARPVEDVLCGDQEYQRLYREAGLVVEALHSPLGLASEPYAWESELHTPPWAIYVLAAGQARLP